MKIRVIKIHKFFIVFFALVVIFSILQIYGWYNPHLLIKNFDNVADDYQKISQMLRNKYSFEGNNRIWLHIDENTYVIFENEINKGKIDRFELNMTQDEILSVKRIYETSYEKRYGNVGVSKQYIVFWTDERFMYGVMNTNEFRKAKKELLKHFKHLKFKRINDSWYEIGYFGL